MPEVDIIESIQKVLPKAATVELLWRLLPAALLVPFVTFFLGRLGTGMERKLEYRTFLHIDEIYAQYKLKNMPGIQDGTKLLMPEEFREVDEEIKQRIKLGTLPTSGLDLTYIKLKPFGKSIILSGSVSLKIEKTDKTQSWDLNVFLPILDINEEIYIPLDRIATLDNEVYLKEITLKYRTQSGEKMRYKSKRKRKDNETTIVSTYSIKKFKMFYWWIDRTRENNAGWIFLNENKDV